MVKEFFGLEMDTKCDFVKDGDMIQDLVSEEELERGRKILKEFGTTE